MKTIVSSLALAVALLAVAPAASAYIDGPRFYKDTDKVSANVATGKVRTLCVCQDGGANHRHTGYLVKSTLGASGGIVVTMTCQIPILTGMDREVISTTNCLTYQVIPR